MADFLRFAQPGILGTVGGILVVWVAYLIIVSAIKRSGDDAKSAIRWAAGVITAVLLAALVWQLVSAATVNTVERSVIDRTGVYFDRFSPQK